MEMRTSQRLLATLCFFLLPWWLMRDSLSGAPLLPQVMAAQPWHRTQKEKQPLTLDDRSAQLQVAEEPRGVVRSVHGLSREVSLVISRGGQGVEAGRHFGDA